MLLFKEQKEIVIDRLANAMKKSKDIAKFSRNLKLYDKAAKYYYQASSYKKAIKLIKLMEPEPNELDFKIFP